MGGRRLPWLEYLTRAKGEEEGTGSWKEHNTHSGVDVTTEIDGMEILQEVRVPRLGWVSPEYLGWGENGIPGMG